MKTHLDRVLQLESAIRAHRDARGDDRCWMDDEALYQILPEGYTPPARDTTVELKNCERYIACRQNPATVYVSPEREIERLRLILQTAVHGTTEAIVKALDPLEQIVDAMKAVDDML